MKRFDIVPEYGEVTNLYKVTHSLGEYVDADIAQELYDILETLSNWDGLPPYYQNRVDELIEKADKE